MGALKLVVTLKAEYAERDANRIYRDCTSLLDVNIERSAL